MARRRDARLMVAILALVVARVALVIATACAVLWVTRHRYDHRTPEARRVRSTGLWAVAVAVLGLVVYYFAE